MSEVGGGEAAYEWGRREGKKEKEQEFRDVLDDESFTLFECDECPAKFFEPQAVAQHRARHHDVDTPYTHQGVEFVDSRDVRRRLQDNGDEG